MVGGKKDSSWHGWDFKTSALWQKLELKNYSFELHKKLYFRHLFFLYMFAIIFFLFMHLLDSYLQFIHVLCALLLRSSLCS